MGSFQISDLFIRSNQIHSHYTRFSAGGNFHVQRSRLSQLLLSFTRSGERIWNKIPLTLCDGAKTLSRANNISYFGQGFGDWGVVCWYECHYQFLPELLIQVKCSPHYIHFSIILVIVLPFLPFTTIISNIIMLDFI